MYNQLKHGDAIRVTFGSRGSQPAIVSHRTAQGNVYVYKLAGGRRWKGPVRIYPQEVMNHITFERDFCNAPPLPAAYSTRS